MDEPAETTPDTAETDSDLEALPAPRHPWRRLTLFTMGATLLGSFALLASLAGELAFTVRGGAPRSLGELARFVPSPRDANTWVQGEGELEAKNAVAFRRPLERDSYRLAKVSGPNQLWVQARVPEDDDDPEHARYVPPTSFVGRLVPAASGGVRLSELGAAIRDAGRPALPSNAWLLLDDETPRSTRWTLGLALLLLAFAGFNLFGLLRLLRPVSD